MATEKLKTATTKRKIKKVDDEVDAYLSSLINDEEEGNMITHKEKGERGKFQRKAVAAGFKEDAANIIKEFVDQKKLTFSNFGKIWRDGHYALLYMGRENERELSETTYEMFTIALSFVTDAKLDLSTRIGAVYLLYCLYEKQPFPKYKVKIRILPEDMRGIQLVFNAARDAFIHECEAVILKLANDNAFHLVGSRFLMGPESSDYRNHPDKMEPVVLQKTWSDGFKEIFDKDSLLKHKEIQDEIEKYQAILGLNLFTNSDTVDNILKFGELAISGDKAIFDLLDEDLEDIKPDIDSDIGTRRVKLKNQQLSAKCASPLSRRRRGKQSTTAADNDVDMDDPNMLGGIEASISMEDIAQRIKQEIEDEIDGTVTIKSEDENEVKNEGQVVIKKEIDSDEESSDADDLEQEHEKHLLELGIVVERSPNSPLKKQKLSSVSKKSSTARKGRLHGANASKSRSKIMKGKRKQISMKTETKESEETSAKRKTLAKEVPESVILDAPKLLGKTKSSKVSVVPKRFLKKASWRKARIVGRTRPEKKIMKGKKIKYYDDSEEEEEV